MKLKLVFASLSLSLAGGCASTSPPRASNADANAVNLVHYSASQGTRLTQCVALADTAWSISSMKLAGKSIEQIRSTYSRHPDQTLIQAEIDEVFGRTYTNSWDFTVEFFRECAVNIAGVPAGDTDTGAYCFQNAMLSGLAQEHQAAGKSKAQAIESLPIKGSTPTLLVSQVYAAKRTRAEAMMNAWEICMKPMVAR